MKTNIVLLVSVFVISLTSCVDLIENKDDLKIETESIQDNKLKLIPAPIHDLSGSQLVEYKERV